ncbi:MAG: glycosyltransferase family 39 protein [Patescibacteria group bacterium]
MKKIYGLLFGAAFLLIYFLVFRPLTSGFTLGESDEIIYMQMAENFRNLHSPVFGGQPFYYDLPLYPLVAAGLSLLTGNFLFAVKLLSFLSVLLSAVLIFFYLKFKLGNSVPAFGAGLLFLFFPLVLYYGQIGIIEPFLAFLLLAAAFTLDMAISQGSLRFAVLSGFLLGGSILTKYTGLITYLFIGVCLFIRSLDWNRRLGWRDSLKVDRNSFLILALATSVFLPVIIYFRIFDRENFTYQTGTIFGFWDKPSPVVFPAWFNWDNFSYWLTPVVCVLIFGGLFFFYRQRNLRLIFWLSLLTLTALMARPIFHLRYLYVVLPYAAIIISLLFWKISFHRRALYLLILTVLLLYLAPYNVTAFASARHRLLERSVAAVGLPRADFNGFIFSNFWPNFYASLARTDRASWLSDDNREVQAFYPKSENNSFELLQQYGGYVFVDKLYSQKIGHPEARLRALEKIKEEKTPLMILSEEGPNFPFFRENLDTVTIYEYQ